MIDLLDKIYPCAFPYQFVWKREDKKFNLKGTLLKGLYWKW